MTEKSHANGYKKYSLAIIKALQPSIKASMKQYRKEFREAIRNLLLDKPGKRQINRYLTDREIIINKITLGFGEIDDTVEILRRINRYMKRLPRNESYEGKIGFISFHVSGYFNEIYILQQRLDGYLTTISRIFRKNHLMLEIRPELDKLVNDSFKGILLTRGGHVHKKRFDEDDLGRLRFLSLLCSDSTNASFESTYRMALRKYRRKWDEIIRKNNSELSKLLDIYFSALLAIVINNDGSWNLPTPKRG